MIRRIDNVERSKSLELNNYIREGKKRDKMPAKIWICPWEGEDRAVISDKQPFCEYVGRLERLPNGSLNGRSSPCGEPMIPYVLKEKNDRS